MTSLADSRLKSWLAMATWLLAFFRDSAAPCILLLQADSTTLHRTTRFVVKLKCRDLHLASPVCLVLGSWPMF